MAAALMTGLGRLAAGGEEDGTLPFPTNDPGGPSFTADGAASGAFVSCDCDGGAPLPRARTAGAPDDERTTVADGATPEPSAQLSIISALDAGSRKAGWASTRARWTVLRRSRSASSAAASVVVGGLLLLSAAPPPPRSCPRRSLCARMASSLLRIRSARLLAAAEAPPPPVPPARPAPSTARRDAATAAAVDSDDGEGRASISSTTSSGRPSVLAMVDLFDELDYLFATYDRSFSSTRRQY